MILFVVATVALTLFSTAVLLYVSLATGLGPWIGPMLVVLCRMGIWMTHRRHEKQTTALATIISSYGGAIATGIGFSLTTLYFVDAGTWHAWMADPLWFCGFMALLVLSAGLFGVALARRIAPALLADTTISFPVSAAIISAIESAHGLVHNLFFGGGILLAGVIGLLRDGWGSVAALVPVAWSLLPSVFGSVVVFELAPVCWAAGFLAGSSIVRPLLVGMVAKYAVLMPLWQVTRDVAWGGLSLLQTSDITFAFCSGLLLSGLLKSCWQSPARLWQQMWRAVATLSKNTTVVRQGLGMELLAGAAMTGICLALSMPIVAIVLFIGFLVPLLENLGNFSARTGLATYGRYMTLIMLPLLCMPGVSSLQIVVVCTLIGIAGAAVVDTLFSYKIGQYFEISEDRLRWAQLVGIVLTAAMVGFLMWLLCTSFTLGESPLIAHRGISRALLMKTFQFNGLIVLLGVILGFILERCKVNVVMVFGGLIMPNSLIIALAIGAAWRAMTTRVEEWTLFWSGVLAGDVLWMLIDMARGL